MTMEGWIPMFFRTLSTMLFILVPGLALTESSGSGINIRFALNMTGVTCQFKVYPENTRNWGTINGLQFSPGKLHLQSGIWMELANCPHRSNSTTTIEVTGNGATTNDANRKFFFKNADSPMNAGFMLFYNDSFDYGAKADYSSTEIRSGDAVDVSRKFLVCDGGTYNNCSGYVYFNAALVCGDKCYGGGKLTGSIRFRIVNR